MEPQMLWSALQTHVPLQEIAIRLCVAAVLGMVIGFDREAHHKPAGLRTHALVALAAAAFTVLTFELVHAVAEMGDSIRADPVRLIEAVVGGVAFLGAGTIIQSRGTVRGITTGASMWLAGAIGVAAGGGYYAMAVITLLFAMAVLTLVGLLIRATGTKDEEQRAGGD